ncbi:hypothetical protein ElyMa_004164500 [Elysia marginata]|uniref:B box-type domain-containing protein n=1 Tax=Elysia marginata TaxID=1093978 RepID=A0AAV4GJE4_9GAST|nr:hypothetical protein ElyMa_004164500 [Elysia marginata]
MEPEAITRDDVSDEDLPLAHLNKAACDSGEEDDDNIPLSKLIQTNPRPSTEPSSSDEESSYTYDSDADPEFSPGKCEVRRCGEDVWAACENCEILVCYDHCIEEISSCSEHGKVLRKKQKLARSRTAQKTTRNAPTITVENKSPENSCDKRKDFDEQGQEQNGISGEAMDQRQKPERKRKSKLQREEEIKKQKTEREKKKYSVKAGCGSGCRRKIKCSEAVLQEEQIQINQHYLDMQFEARKEFIIQSVVREECQRRTTKNAKKTKSWSYQYTLLKPNGVRVRVCKTFFLATLGLNPKNDWIITQLSQTQKNEFPDAAHFSDNRGKHSNYKYNHEDVMELPITARSPAFLICASNVNGVKRALLMMQIAFVYNYTCKKSCSLGILRVTHHALTVAKGRFNQGGLSLEILTFNLGNTHGPLELHQQPPADDAAAMLYLGRHHGQQQQPAHSQHSPRRLADEEKHLYENQLNQWSENTQSPNKDKYIDLHDRGGGGDMLDYGSGDPNGQPGAGAGGGKPKKVIYEVVV